MINKCKKPQSHTVLKFQAADYHSSKLMADKSLMPSFKISVPSNTNLTHKTILLYFRNSLRLKSCKQVELRGIRHSVDYFGHVPVLGRLRDLKLSQILYKISPDTCLEGTESSSEEEDISENNISESESVSHTETEQSQDGASLGDKACSQDQTLQSDLTEMVASIMGLLVLKKQEKI